MSKMSGKVVANDVQVDSTRNDESLVRTNLLSFKLTTVSFYRRNVLSYRKNCMLDAKVSLCHKTATQKVLKTFLCIFFSYIFG